MKKWMKVLLITAVSLVALGIFLTVMSLVFGENPMQEIRKDVLRDGHYEYAYEVSPEDIRELEINWVAGNVIIEPYDGDTILLQEQCAETIPEKNRLYLKRDSDSLEIQYWKGRWKVDLGDMLSKDLRIQLPRELAENLQELSVDNVGAAIHLQDLQMEELEVSSVSGDLKGLGLQIREVEFETVSGDMQLQFAACPRKLDAESVSGDAELVVPEGSQIRTRLDSVSGELQSDAPYLGEKDVVPGEFTMHSVSGDMTVRMDKRQ